MWQRRQQEPQPGTFGVDLAPQEKSLVRAYRNREHIGVSALFRSSIYCIVVAALFLYLALSQDEPRYAVGVFAMFLWYLAIRIYSARRIAGIMPRILQRYEKRIVHLEEQMKRIQSHNT
jgi:uncharacterized membrane protein